MRKKKSSKITKCSLNALKRNRNRPAWKCYRTYDLAWIIESNYWTRRGTKVAVESFIEEKERREAILKELTKTCPYAENLSENLHDPERLFQATKAFEMAVAELDAMLANPLNVVC